MIAIPSSEYVQNASHDWFAKAAENYVRYLFAAAEFVVYGEGLWAADAAVRDTLRDRWFCIEVRSSCTREKPKRKGSEKLKGLDIVADVTLKDGRFNVVLTRLLPGGCRDANCRLVSPTSEQLREWMNAF